MSPIGTLNSPDSSKRKDLKLTTNSTDPGTSLGNELTARQISADSSQRSMEDIIPGTVTATLPTRSDSMPRGITEDSHANRQQIIEPAVNIINAINALKTISKYKTSNYVDINEIFKLVRNFIIGYDENKDKIDKNTKQKINSILDTNTKRWQDIGQSPLFIPELQEFTPDMIQSIKDISQDTDFIEILENIKQERLQILQNAIKEGKIILKHNIESHRIITHELQQNNKAKIPNPNPRLSGIMSILTPGCCSRVSTRD